jgi:hypothetical protein
MKGSFFSALAARDRVNKGAYRGGHPLLIDHISSWMFPTPRKRIREHTWRKFLTNLKTMYKEIGLALYRDLYRSLTIRISEDCFNVKKKKTSRLIPRLFQWSKEKSVTFRSYTFLNVNNVADMTCQRFMSRYKVVDRHFAHLCLLPSPFFSLIFFY